MTNRLIVKFKKLYNDTVLPAKATKGSAAYDCYIHSFNKIGNPSDKNFIEVSGNTFRLNPQERIAVGLGYATKIPNGYYMNLVPRSGLSTWYGLQIVNSPATIDADFTLEWKVILYNSGSIPLDLKIGDRICQTMLKKIINFNSEIVEDLEETERKGGFGSTGK